MRVAFMYGPWCDNSRPIDFDHLADSSRGLTGSEHSCIQYALAMKERGHEIALYASKQGEARDWNGIRLCDNARIVAEDMKRFDAICSWNEPDVLREMPREPVRLMNQQLNDFSYCKPGFDEFVDVYTSPSAHHMEYLKRESSDVGGRGTTASKWHVLPNGCAPWAYQEGGSSQPVPERIPGRVIWASSADRGLHLLLQWWPEIKKAVPHASLRCFYNMAYDSLEQLEIYNPTANPNITTDVLEIAQRVRYIRYALKKLEASNLDVKHEGSVSRLRMRNVMCESEVLAYPCDTIRYTEGFSVTTMEACAGGVLPIITDVDSLGHIYGSAVPMVKWPPQKDEYISLVVRGLTDKAWREEQLVHTRTLADQHSWKVLSALLENILMNALAKKNTLRPKASEEHPPPWVLKQLQTSAGSVSPRGDTNGVVAMTLKSKMPWERSTP